MANACPPCSLPIKRVIYVIHSQAICKNQASLNWILFLITFDVSAIPITTQLSNTCSQLPRDTYSCFCQLEHGRGTERRNLIGDVFRITQPILAIQYRTYTRMRQYNYQG